MEGIRLNSKKVESPGFGRLSDPLWLFLGRWLERKGIPSLAESCFRNAAGGGGKLAVEAGFRLSQRLLASDRNADAVNVCEKALKSDPGHARLWCALGAARRRLAQMDAARAAYERAIALDPGYAPARSNLGEWWLVKGDWIAALAHFDGALKLEPRLFQALSNRVAALYELGRFEEAEAAARKAIAMHPTEAALHVNLGNVLLHTGKGRLAVKSFQKALECDPASPEANLALSTLLGETHRLAEALGYIEHEITVKGETAQRLAMVAMAQQAKGDWTGAEKTCLKVLEMQPSHISALITLAGCHIARGDHRGALRLHEKALEANPAMPAIQSNIAFDSTYLPDLSAEEVFAYHRGWVDAFGKATPLPPVPRDRGADPKRALRIGYVSGDFGTHPVGFLLRDVIRYHDRSSCSIHCYSMMRGADDVTNAIRESADSWVDALLMSDEELANKIREDRIDILVDLSGHTAYNRPPGLREKACARSGDLDRVFPFHRPGLHRLLHHRPDHDAEGLRTAVLRDLRLASEHAVLLLASGVRRCRIATPVKRARQYHLRMFQPHRKDRRSRHRGVGRDRPGRARQPTAAQVGKARVRGTRESASPSFRPPWPRARQARASGPFCAPGNAGRIWRSGHRSRPVPFQRWHDDARGAMDGGPRGCAGGQKRRLEAVDFRTGEHRLARARVSRRAVLCCRRRGARR